MQPSRTNQTTGSHAYVACPCEPTCLYGSHSPIWPCPCGSHDLAQILTRQCGSPVWAHMLVWPTCPTWPSPCGLHCNSPILGLIGTVVLEPQIRVENNFFYYMVCIMIDMSCENFDTKILSIKCLITRRTKSHKIRKLNSSSYKN